MAWGKRKDGQAYNKDKPKGMSGAGQKTAPTSDVHMKEHQKNERVLDLLNKKWYTKKALIKESYDVFIKDLDPNDFDSKNDMKATAMDEAEEYVEENSISEAEYKKLEKEKMKEAHDEFVDEIGDLA
jgi:hypothetical protein